MSHTAVARKQLQHMTVLAIHTIPRPPVHPRHLLLPSALPCRSSGDGDYEVCDDFIIDDWLRQKLKASEDELVKEKECVGHLIGVEGAACRLVGAEDTMLPGEN